MILDLSESQIKKCIDGLEALEDKSVHDLVLLLKAALYDFMQGPNDD